MKVVALFSVAVLLSSAGIASAQLNVDFQHTTTASPGVTQSGFSPFVQDLTNTTSDTRTFGNVNVTIGSKSTLLDGVFTRGGLTNSGAFTNANIYNDFAFDNSGPGNNTADLTLSLNGPGITPNALYELTFFSYDPDPTQGNHQVTISPTSGTTGTPLAINWLASNIPVSNNQNAATGLFRADGAGNLNFTLIDNYTGATTDTGIRLNAFQLNAVPEPELVTLWCVAGLGIALFGRRRAAKQQLK